MDEMKKSDIGSPLWRERNELFSPITYMPPCPPPPVANWAIMGQYSGPAFLYNEPIQGCCGNCYLIAALTSVAWAAPTSINRYPTFQFMDPATNAISSVTLTSENLPVDANNKLIFARSTTGKTWPMLYEKAYASWKGCASLGGNPDHPDISQLAGGAGIYGLISVARFRNYRDFHPAQQTADQIIASIPRSPSGKTMFPTVACANDHTYSVLGIYQGINIVLRNPDISQNEPQYALNAGAWNAGPGAYINFAVGDDGIFAISANDFKQNFESYGYVRP